MWITFYVPRHNCESKKKVAPFFFCLLYDKQMVMMRAKEGRKANEVLCFYNFIVRSHIVQ